MDEFEFDEENPFGEEFELDDVINKGELNSPIAKKGLDQSRRTDPEFNTRGYSQSDIDQLVNYDQERRKKLNFKSRLNDEIDLEAAHQEELENSFKDYLVYPRISGQSQMRGDKTLIPNSHVVKSDKFVEIVDAPKLKKKHSPATIIVNRDEAGDIDNVEIVCDCGDRILLKFEKTDPFDLEKTKLETEKISGPVPFEFDEESPIDVDNKQDTISEINNDDDFFSSDATPSKKIDKVEEVEEEFFDEDFGSDEDLDLGNIGIDLSGIV
jgi:hypothetical protein